MTDYLQPQVGIGLLLTRGEEVLLGRRKGSHGAGEFNTPGGHLDPGESIEESILRELAEEAGAHMQVKNLGFLCVSNLTKYAPKHYVDIGMTAEWVSGEPEVCEPDKLESWGWYPLDGLPDELFDGLANYIEAYRTGCTYFPTT